MEKMASGISESTVSEKNSAKSPDTAGKAKKKTDVFVSLQMQKEQQEKRDKLVELLHKDTDKLTESNDFCYYFYQCSTGENLFLHPVSLKLIHQEFENDFSKYPLRIEARIEEIEYDILDLTTSHRGPHKQLKYLSHLCDSTPFGLVEIDTKALTKTNQPGLQDANGQPIKHALIKKKIWQDNSK